MEGRGNRKEGEGNDRGKQRGVGGRGRGYRRGAVQPYHFLDRVDAYISVCQLQSFWLRSRTLTLS
jgi:hypothetical protein